MDVTIVIPVLNQLHFTRQCLESLNASGYDDSLVVVVNNASKDGTAEYLAGRPKLQVITNTENRACSAAWNQGFNARKTKWTVFLNNDTVLTPGWLENLANFAEQESVDIACPAKTDGELNYDLQRHTVEFTQKMKQVRRWNVAHGVCFLVARHVFEKIGGFDENFTKGGNEDTDFFWRAQAAGFKLGITGGVYIHHFGGVTQKALIVERGSTRDETVGYFREKWKLSLADRRWLQLKRKSIAAWHQTTERWRHGHTLDEKRKDGRVFYH